MSKIIRALKQVQDDRDSRRPTSAIRREHPARSVIRDALRDLNRRRTDTERSKSESGTSHVVEEFERLGEEFSKLQERQMAVLSGMRGLLDETPPSEDRTQEKQESTHLNDLDIERLESLIFAGRKKG